LPPYDPQMPQRHQVIIVGGGPVGIALAVDLAQRGISCVVVERHDGVGTIPKGQNLMHRSLEHFYFWGCVDELRAARVLPQGYPIGGITAYESLMGEYWYMPEGLGGANTFFFQQNERLPQYRTEEVLRARLAKLPSASCRFRVAASSIDQDEAGARVTVASTEWPYEEEVLEADFVVGCDGARSLVREQLGIERRGRDFDQKMALAVFRSAELDEGLARFPERTTYRVVHPDFEGKWLFFGRVGIGEWFFHGPVPRETGTEDRAAVLELMQKAAGFAFSCEFEHLGFWELRIEVATRYRVGRGFIAGDACHSHPPYGGLGLNTGLEDVANLGWKLAGVLQGWGGETLLDSYSAERQPIFEQTGEQVIASWIDTEATFLERFRPERDRPEFEEQWANRTGGEMAPSWYEPHYDSSPVVVGAPGNSTGIRGQHELAARPGHHLSPQLLSSGRNVYEVLGRGFTLLAFGVATDEIEQLRAAASGLGVPLEVIEDTFEDGRAAYGARLMLVRPDQFVAWCGEHAPEQPEMLFEVVAGLGARAER
jgi:2-polyprenyl-6-methoxyphenol hydroxylase-like FAD-dependent oxidoreductase